MPGHVTSARFMLTCLLSRWVIEVSKPVKASCSCKDHFLFFQKYYALERCKQTSNRQDPHQSQALLLRKTVFHRIHFLYQFQPPLRVSSPQEQDPHLDIHRKLSEVPPC